MLKFSPKKRLFFGDNLIGRKFLFVFIE